MSNTFQFLLLVFLMISACTSSSPPEAQQITRPEFGSILDSANVRGSILIYDLKADTYYSNDFARCDSAFIPASTFKIPNSLIALETGVIKDDSTIIEWNGYENTVPIWNQDLYFRDAFHYSCVPCYRQIAREVGLERMQTYLQKLDFGQMDVDSANLDLFWLMGNSKISQQQQIEFLQRFYHDQLPFSKNTLKTAKHMMVREENDQYKLTAKTGQSVGLICWYVGFLETKEKVYFFATNVVPKGALDRNARISTTMAAFKLLELM